MKFLVMCCVSLFIVGGSASAASKDSVADPVFARFASALGYPDARTVEAVKKELTAEWIGKSKEDVQSYARRVIQNRGGFGATKNGGRGSRPDLLALSYRSELLAKETASLRIQFFYDESVKVARIECTSSP